MNASAARDAAARTAMVPLRSPCVAWRRAIPLFDAHIGRPVTLAQRIEQWPCGSTEGRRHCRPNKRCAAGTDRVCRACSRARDAGCRSRSMVRRGCFHEAGKALFNMREGQFNLACAQCHDDLAGASAWQAASFRRGTRTAYPEYRLEWQGMGSLERRIRNCMVGVRAEPFRRRFDGDGGTAALISARDRTAWRSKTPAVRP